MKAFLKSVVAGLLALVLTAAEAFAQERPAFSRQELDQMLAPVALYPDPLLSQVLMAATYPLEVVQAARWSRANPNLRGQDAVRAVEPMDWDPSVKSLVAFPQVLHRMDENLDWTQRLGEAFLEQEPHVMEAIQGLRQRAEQEGYLRSNERMQVTRQDEHILIEPAQPQVVYVPYYDPTVAYGPWWWPAYPPVYWGPPPGYYAWPGYAPGFFWGTGIAISWGFFFGHFDWRHHHVKVVHVDHRHPVQKAPHSQPVKWQHNPVHRRNVPYRHMVSRPTFVNQPALSRDGRPRPVTRQDTPGTRPQTRNAAPQSRPQFAAPQSRPQAAAPQPRPERIAPQARNPLPERSARADIQRPQPRAIEPRPGFGAPPVGSVPRSATPPPVVRAEPRSIPPAAQPRPVPRQQFEPARRAAPSRPTQERFAAPRASVGGPMHAPRFEGNASRGGSVRPNAGGGHPHGGSASAGGGRRF
jgi:hypothetical protein